MKEQVLDGIHEYPSYFKGIEQVLADFWYLTIYEPLAKLVYNLTDIKTKLNSKASLKKALQSGKIRYQGGSFVGEFNSSISRDLRSLGAEWNRKTKSFKLSEASLPLDVKISIAQGTDKLRDVYKAVKSELDKMGEFAQEALTQMGVEPELDYIFAGLDKQFKSTLASSLTIQPEISPQLKKKLTDYYKQELNTYVDEWTKEAISRLRAKVNENVFQGFRADRLSKQIQSEFGISKRKAKFLARQETSLLVSAYREERYSEAGVKKYKWSTSHDERVRPDHRELNGKIFSWASPPVVDKAVGRRANPGEDFGCRCVALPVVVVGEKEYV